MGFRRQLAERIRDARRDMGVTQAEFSMMIDVSQSSVGSYETGRIMPSLGVMARISAVTGQALEDLVPRVEVAIAPCEGQTTLELGDA